MRRNMKTEERLPKRKVEQTKEESAFQREGPIKAKDRD